MPDNNVLPSSTEIGYVSSGYHIFNKFLPSTITIHIIGLLSRKHEKWPSPRIISVYHLSTQFDLDDLMNVLLHHAHFMSGGEKKGQHL